MARDDSSFQKLLFAFVLLLLSAFSLALFEKDTASKVGEKAPILCFGEHIKRDFFSRFSAF